tara:strand:- start:144 stop:536 length:393 start_codon:yes stop_codon:yes gene_type:complete
MNYYAMMDQYKNVDANSKLEKADNHEYIKLIFDDLLKNLESLSYSISNEPIKSCIKSKSFSQSLVALMILQKSLDFENGEPIASNLFNIYEYCRKSVIKNYRNKETKDIDQSIECLKDIQDAWKKIKISS